MSDFRYLAPVMSVFGLPEYAIVTLESALPNLYTNMVSYCAETGIDLPASYTCSDGTREWICPISWHAYGSVYDRANVTYLTSEWSDLCYSSGYPYSGVSVSAPDQLCPVSFFEDFMSDMSDYPVFSDDVLSEVESELLSESIDGYYLSELSSSVEDAFDSDKEDDVRYSGVVDLDAQFWCDAIHMALDMRILGETVINADTLELDNWGHFVQVMIFLTEAKMSDSGEMGEYTESDMSEMSDLVADAEEAYIRTLTATDLAWRNLRQHEQSRIIRRHLSDMRELAAL